MRNIDPVIICFILYYYFTIANNLELGNVGLAKFSPWVLMVVDWLLMSPMLFLHLQKRGVTTYLWVLNTDQQFQRAFNLGVQGVMTDYPSQLRQFLDKKRK